MLAPRQDITRQALLSLQAEVGGQIVGSKLYPITPQLSALLPLKPDCELQRRWYVVQTHAQQEATVESEIKKLKLDAYCPREPKMVRVNAVKHKPVKKPMMIGYVFAGYDPGYDRWEAIFGVRGVMRMLPWPVGEHEMQRVLYLELDRAGGRKANMPKIDLSIDDLVRILEGPFASFLAFVRAVDEDRHEVKLEIDIFGRPTPFVISAQHVEAV